MRYLILIIFISFIGSLEAQDFSRQDSLRGSITPERIWWDLTYYDLSIEVEPEKKKIIGCNTIQYKVLQSHDVMQIDLQNPLTITRIVQNNKELEWNTEGFAHFIQLSSSQKVGDLNEVTIYYEGIPKAAVRPPWDGGITWSRDRDGEHFIASSCQGLGASVWWPCKDHMYDEVDGMTIRVEVPEHLTNVSNGRLKSVDHDKVKGTRTFHYEVENPINNYGVNINIGNYVSWQEKYQGENGELDIFYYALKSDEDKARKQFKQVPKMLEAFEYWFGSYPFYEDGYKLVQAPYLGMEHQSSITYGNDFVNGYRGTDLSGTGWGMKFDFIIIHESGHEWFANNITHKDQADMWIHESFTNYSESLFLEYYYGKGAGLEYVRGTRMQILNDVPLIASYDVNDDSYSLDVYYKGGNILNTLRTIVNDDDIWRSMLRGMNKHFYHQTITSKQMEDYMAEYLDRNLTSFFDQYLRDRRCPILEYYIQDQKLFYRWINAVPSFDMEVDIFSDNTEVRIHPTTHWSSIDWDSLRTIEVDLNYYVGLLKSR